MLGEIMRRVAMASLVGFIVGGLWVLATWKAELDSPAPTIFSKPFSAPIGPEPARPFLSGSRPNAEPSFDQVLFEDDQVIRVG